MRYEDIRKKVLSEPGAMEEYERLEPEFQIVQSIIEARYQKKLTQQELANLTGIDRSDINRLENANANPTIDTLRRIANALDKKLVIQFK